MTIQSKETDPTYALAIRQGLTEQVVNEWIQSSIASAHESGLSTTDVVMRLQLPESTAQETVMEFFYSRVQPVHLARTAIHTYFEDRNVQIASRLNAADDMKHSSLDFTFTD